ncbi:uncharacterized protein LOC134215278 isoform X2 [Armigeres subalbatus]|uniref:uncharacterized protein LOC134215278 isoform X2 n=1 Tax=Armigeres subalbatus TaxID=124917 RepID=UPI002ED44D0C
MFKLLAVFAVLCGIPAQNAFVHHQRPMAYRTAQRTMYGVHFQNQQFRNQRVAAFPEEAHLNDIDGAYLPADDPNADSLPAQYPLEQIPVEDKPQEEVPVLYDPQVENPIADEPSAVPVVPVDTSLIPEKKVKKVPVQTDSIEEEAQNTQIERRRGTSRSVVPNVYFPINFGNTNGGAIAVANSYSTGKNGSSISTATAYGNPVTAELRRSSSLLRKRPAKVRVQH